jgi:predicted transcriptional regulator
MSTHKRALVSKLAFSIAPELLARVERVRQVTGESRSALISRALARLTDAELAQARVRRYVEAYRENPETSLGLDET